MTVTIEQIIGDIYDCAVNPELWPATLGKLRDFAGCAYVMVGFIDLSQVNEFGQPIVQSKKKFSEWDAVWLQRLEQQLMAIPHINRLIHSGIDVPWTQMQYMSEAEFHQSDFYKNWVKPQKLRDCLNTLFIDRKVVRGVMAMARYEGSPLMGERERRIATIVNPHIRRAIAINDLVDKGNLALALYRKVLDALSVAVVVVGAGGRLVFANAKAQSLLSSADLLCLAGGKVAVTRADITCTKFEDAVARAIKGDRAVGISGIGVPLTGKSGERAAAYVLPITGSDLRGHSGQGMPRYSSRAGENSSPWQSKSCARCLISR